MIDLRLQNGKEKVSVIETFDKKVKLISRIPEEGLENRPVGHYEIVGPHITMGVEKILRFTNLNYKIEVQEFENLEALKKHIEEKNLEISVDHLHGDFKGGEPPKEKQIIYVEVPVIWKRRNVR
jgi:hypothetical protein